jgi:hypothetical protein
MVFHPGQHLVNLTDFPTPFGAASIRKQAVRFIKNQECPDVPCLSERRRYLLLTLTNIRTQKVGRSFQEYR